MESRVRLNILLDGRKADLNRTRGYWYDTKGQQFGEILRANDDGIVTPGPTAGTDYLELRMSTDIKKGVTCGTDKDISIVITYVVKLDDGHWAYVRHTGGAIVRQYQNGVV